MKLDANAKGLRLIFIISVICLGLVCILGTGGGGGGGDAATTIPATTTIPNSTVVSKLIISDIIPSSGQTGDTVFISYSGGEKPLVFWSGLTIDTTPVEGTSDKLSFIVPANAESGPLSLKVKDGSSISNSVWFTVSKSSVLQPAADAIVSDEFGNSVAVNQVLISLKDGSDSILVAERVARLVGGKIVGQIPLIAGYQILLDSTTMSELDDYIKILIADPDVEFVLKNTLESKEAIDWSKDWDHQYQRDNNKVEEGADLYCEKVHPTDTGKIRPVFTSIGVVEEGLDFDVDDFKNYYDLGRLNNIAIYAKDGDVSEQDKKGNATEKGKSSKHATNVTGVIAAELGNYHMAGILQAISGAHGGFNILVEDSGGWLFSDFATTGRMLEAGIQVINWSFGIHKKGAKTNAGKDVTNNLRDPLIFSPYHRSAIKLIRKIEEKYPNVIIVATAGNGNTNAGDEAFRSPSSIVSENLLVVGAHSADNSPVRDYSYWDSSNIYSNYGNRVDIAASGLILDYTGNVSNGTSFAAPLVTATIGAMLSIEPDLAPIEIKKLLRQSALPIENEVSLSDGKKDVFTAPLTEAEVGNDPTRINKGARLNVEGAIQAVIDKRMNRTIPEGDPLEVDLKFGLLSDVTKTVLVTLSKETIFDKVDILFLVDVSGSYGDDIAQFKAQAAKIVNAFMSGGSNVEIGVASFSDFPISPFGVNDDYAYRLQQPLTSNTNDIIDAINALKLLNGYDYQESQLEGLYQAASGIGRTVSGTPNANISPSSVGWRDGSLPVIFLATDASFHNSDTETTYPGEGWEKTVTYLNSKKIRVYGLQAGSTITDVTKLVDQTGGKSFELSSNSSEIVSAIEDALDSASKGVRIGLQKNGDFAGLITGINPEYYDNVYPGDTKSFDVKFSRKFFGDDIGTHVFSLRLDVIAEDVATIMLFPVTVTIK